MDLTKKQLERVDKVNTQIQKRIEDGAKIRQWSGMQSEDKEKGFPARNTFNVNLIVNEDGNNSFFKTCDNLLPALKNTGEYLRAEFYGTKMICDATYPSKYDRVTVKAEDGTSEDMPALELQFTLENVPRIQEYGTEESHTKFSDALKNHRAKIGVVADLPIRERKEEPAETVEDPFA